MSNKFIPALVAGVAAACLVGGAASAQMTSPMGKENTVMVGGAAMYPSRNIVQNAVNSKDHTILVTAVQAAGLVDTLSSPGPFTVFAPTNAAFAKLPAGTVESLLQPANVGMLRTVLTYHVVPGSYDAATIIGAIKAGGGKATLKTVQGEEITASIEGGKVVVTDKRGGKATVTAADLRQSNGIIHVTDAVSLPG